MIDAPSPKKSDLGVRTLSAIVMVAVAGLALWLGGAVWIAFVGAIGAVALYEWRKLVLGFAQGLGEQVAWIAGGVLYIGFAIAALMVARRIGVPHVILPVMITILTDTGAFFAGRTFGGPKIAPAISPSKTWSGLIGGMIAAGIGAAWWNGQFAYHGAWTAPRIAAGLALGAALAVVAQAGDFLESRMKRRAGVKDSGTMLPGHGGVLDRIDGLLAVLFVGGLAWVAILVAVE